MKRLYEPPAYDTATWPESYWRWSVADVPEYAPLEADTNCEVAIIGAGYTGLSAALELAERFGASAVVLEAAQPGWGASGRNGGFVGLGGTKLSPERLVRRYGAQKVRAFHAVQRAAVERVADNLARYDIAADTHSDGELCVAHRPSAMEALRDEARFLEEMLGEEIELLSRSALAERGMGPAGFHGGAIIKPGFALNPMKYVLGLARAVVGAGQRIHGASPVTSLTREAEAWRLTTPRASLTARRVIVATNGYSSDDIPPALAGTVLPALTSILVTRPLTADEIAAQGWSSDLMTFDTRRLLHYFRLMPDGRFLFGTRGGLSASAGAMRRIRAMGRRHLNALFPEWAHVETPFFWSGLVALTARLTPILGPLPGAPGVVASLGYHGSGVAMGSLSGRLAAGLVCGEDARPDLMCEAPQRFPLAGLRKMGLRAAYMGLMLADGPVR